MKSFLSFSLSAVLALSLVACGGGGGSTETANVAAGDVRLAANPASTAAVANKKFTFDGGIPALGTGGVATELQFTSGSKFAISAGTGSASGDTTYGSCIFTVTASTFAAPHPLAVGSDPIRIHPCEVEVESKGAAATGAIFSTSASLVLGTLISNDVPLAIQIQPDGQVLVGGTVIGSVTVTPTTGATGG